MVELLEKGLVFGHDLVELELALWTPPKRREFLRSYQLLDRVPNLSILEVARFIEIQSLYGRGCGVVDIAILGSCVAHGAKLLTFDKRLHALAIEQGVAFNQNTLAFISSDDTQKRV